MSRTRKLDAVEIRVLGALLEKEQTTPEQYPLTANAVIAACNQKTNRDPVTHFTETEVVEALDRRWGLDKKSKAIMTLLLLRGPQTAGELRTRGERMYAFASVAEVEGTLAKLADGFDALVCELPRQPGQRETRWVHLESAEGDHRELEATAPPPRVAEPRPAEAGEVAGGRRSPYDERLESLESTVQGLQDTVSGLESTLATLQATVAAIDSKLRALSVDLGVE